jgi:hypothetical protein
MMQHHASHFTIKLKLLNQVELNQLIPNYNQLYGLLRSRTTIHTVEWNILHTIQYRLCGSRYARQLVVVTARCVFSGDSPGSPGLPSYMSVCV